MRTTPTKWDRSQVSACSQSDETLGEVLKQYVYIEPETAYTRVVGINSAEDSHSRRSRGADTPLPACVVSRDHAEGSYQRGHPPFQPNSGRASFFQPEQRRDTPLLL